MQRCEGDLELRERRVTLFQEVTFLIIESSNPWITHQKKRKCFSKYYREQILGCVVLRHEKVGQK